MGIDLTGLRALFMVKRLKLGDFSQTATLGRQEIFFLESEFEKFAQSAALGIGYEPAFSFSNFQEPLLKALGAAEVTSFDASPYEGATAIQDFNKPLAPQFEKRFSMFLDFGSMEHVFNIPQVVRNVNALLRPGGLALIVTNADGDAGHGFYQFSPEFFYNVFSPRNGFADTAVFLADVGDPLVWLAVKSPEKLKGRNSIPRGQRLLAVVVTRKVADVSDVSAQQSDYSTTAWQNQGYKHSQGIGPARRLMRRMFSMTPIAFIRLRQLRSHWRQQKKFRTQTVDFCPETSAIGPLGLVPEN
jgi:hypothetical protein